MSLEELPVTQRRRYLRHLTALSAEQRFLATLDTIETARAFMEAGIRARQPGFSARGVQAKVASLLVGPELARRLHGEAAEES
jgi:hypothetical protein